VSGSPRRDIVVVGASAGGVEALSRFASLLPAGLAAAVFVVLHVPPGIRSRLPEILDRRGPLPARHARDGDLVEAGRILVAPPDYHLEVGATRVRLVHGPRRNSSRPSVDVLFRSAAANHRSRVVGVVLSGYLDDGAEGIREIVRAGGVGIAQDPAEALNPEMPENAIERASLDLVLPVEEIARRVAEMAAGGVSVGGRVMGGEPKEELLEPERPDVQIGADDTPGVPTGLTCPECHGVLWAGPDSTSEVLHCRVGHAYSIETLEEEQRLAVERALWAGVRSLREQSAISGHIARRAEERGTESIARRYRLRERAAEANADVLEQMLTGDVADEDDLKAQLS
jgi:two-component system, chemotaxis family, protein-glutamate methylesterase/glutaminase